MQVTAQKYMSWIFPHVGGASRQWWMVMIDLQHDGGGIVAEIEPGAGKYLVVRMLAGSSRSSALFDIWLDICEGNGSELWSCGKTVEILPYSFGVTWIICSIMCGIDLVWYIDFFLQCNYGDYFSVIALFYPQRYKILRDLRTCIKNVVIVKNRKSGVHCLFVCFSMHLQNTICFIFYNIPCICVIIFHLLSWFLRCLLALTLLGTNILFKLFNALFPKAFFLFLKNISLL